MSVSNFEELAKHVGHDIEVVGYGKKGKKPYVNAAVECTECGEVLLDFDKDMRKQNIVPNKITVSISEQELDEIKDGKEFDWEFDGLKVHIKLEIDEERDGDA